MARKPRDKTATTAQTRAGRAAVASARRSNSGRGWWIGVAAIVLVVAVVVILGVTLSHPGAGTAAANPQQDANPALLASTGGQASGATVDGIASSSTEQVLFHIHAHLAIYINGNPKLIPYGIGIVLPYQLATSRDGQFVNGGSAFYWLHTHDDTGVIHIESPQRRTFTLGDFFDIWHQPLSPNQIGPASGPVTAYVNGTPVTGDPRAIALDQHAVIQLDLGGVRTAPRPHTFPAGL
ncbi:hypothetical protein [Pseudonocardia sp. GCM10023141]|uniref:hypothetical protein n=1 Tax=Pseudonocardia sp. GCM10023141 TaxID=3252653 RepID=UPI0036142E82